MHDFVSVAERRPDPGQDVEVLRDYGCVVMNNGHTAYGCRFGIERTRFDGGLMFVCDMISTGHVTHWRPAESLQVATVDNYPGLRDLLPE